MKILAFKHNSDEVRRQSSSGGMFTLLAEKTVREGGVVYGAAFDSDWNVGHIGVDSLDGLERLRKSKYVESDFLPAVAQACRDVESGRSVLFSGVPCQIAVLKKRLGAEYDNLLTVEVVCHGAPRREVWQRYLNDLLRREGKTRADIASIDFRDKSTGWETYSFTVRFTDGSVFSERYEGNDFMRMFLADYAIREGCFNCPFKQPDSKADLTLGDLWGMRELLAEHYDTKGASIVIANTERGAEAVRGLSFLGEVAPEGLAVHNPALRAAASRPEDYEDVNSAIGRTLSFARWAGRAMAPKEERKPLKIGILTQPLGHNYGGIVQNLALQETLRRMGHKPETIKYYELPRFPRLRRYLIEKKVKLQRKLTHRWVPIPWEPARMEVCFRHLRGFLRRRIKSTRYSEVLDARFLRSRRYDALIVGSDQVWRPIYNTPGLEYMFCDFAADSPQVRCMAYAASFGVDHWEFSAEEAEMARRNIARFTAVSVRERSGVDLCREQMGRTASHVLDPSLMLRREDYDNIIGSRAMRRVQGNCVGVYVLDLNDEKRAIINRVCSHLGLPAVYFGSADAQTGLYEPVEQWLARFRKSAFIVTDSFHGTAFSVNFHTPFISIVNPERGAARFTSLTGLVGLNDRLVYEGQADGLEQLVDSQIDWAKVEDELDFRRDESMAFLEKL